MTRPITIFWFRRDLRLHDNTGLYHALKSGYKVLPVFIFDTNILGSLPKDDARVTFIHDTLTALNNYLRKHYNSGIAIYMGNPKDIFEKLTKQFIVKQVYANHDYEPYTRKRDNEIKSLLDAKHIPLYTFKDHIIYKPDDIIKRNGAPYKVYTPYMKAWKIKFRSEGIQMYGTKPLLKHLISSELFPYLTLIAIGFERSQQSVVPHDLSTHLLDHYEADRNYPAKAATSRLGPHLRFGTVSIRAVVARASNQKNETFLQELIWREFFMQILWHFPHTMTQSFKPRYDAISWRNNPEEFKHWCEGKTGYPIVDAGMRQLNATGFMHNRVRMIVASFLCKHLLIDWRWGEAYFAQKLHDYDMASNIGNWQ